MLRLLRLVHFVQVVILAIGLGAAVLWVAAAAFTFDQGLLVWGAGIGFASPVVLKFFPRGLKDERMVVASWIVSFAAAAVILYLSGGTAKWSWEDLATEFAILYTAQQALFKIVNERFFNLADPPETRG